MRAVLILSGGMDSTTLLYDIKKDYEVFALSVYYGQRHARELLMASRTCKSLGIPHKKADISSIVSLISNSALTSQKIKMPHGHYEDETMKLTVVPNRNMILLSIAIGYAINIGAKKVFYGAHAGDHAIYPDCRKEFVDAMVQVSKICHYHPISLEAPYLYINKADILRIGLFNGTDYSKTWTCYDPQGSKKACGKCGSCQERLEAFKLNSVKDPLTYAKI